MRVAFIGAKGIPAIYGGVERHVEEVAVRLAARGHKVTVYCRKNYAKYHEPTYRGVFLKVLPAIRAKSLNNISHTFLSLLNTIGRNYDIIHFQNSGPSSLVPVARLLGKRAVSTIHALDYRQAKWNRFARAYLKFGERCACKFTNAAIAVSPLLKDYLEKKYRGKVIFIPNGYSSFTHRNTLEIPDSPVETKKYMLNVGRIIPDRAIDHLIKAFESINTDLKLVIVGGTEFETKYFQWLKMQVTEKERIIFAGQRSGRELEELYSNALIYVHPSLVEGLSIAILEAMSLGLPVICSDIPENRQIVDPEHLYTPEQCDKQVEWLRDPDTPFYALLFNVHSTTDLQRKIEVLIEDSGLRENMSKKEYTYVRENFNWENIVDQIESVYRNCLQ